MQTRSLWRGVAVGLLGVLFATMAFAPRDLAAQPSLVVLVRHGEKATEGGNDPSLSEAGKARSQALADALAMTTPSTIIVSSLKRTAETAVVVSALPLPPMEPPMEPPPLLPPMEPPPMEPPPMLPHHLPKPFRRSPQLATTCRHLSPLLVAPLLLVKRPKLCLST